ncbi:hypothetical protein [Escherichia sp. E1V33]|uniref:hypothetical protein n=1 Tax=Escherichia sp. E1V33 TaxID=2478976 RepID=UPI0013EED394|nr:hypothetical protein [Escherichia sp. E1V33]
MQPTAEMSHSGGALDFLYTRPIPLALLTLAAFTLLTPVIRKIMRLLPNVGECEADDQL